MYLARLIPSAAPFPEVDLLIAETPSCVLLLLTLLLIPQVRPALLPQRRQILIKWTPLLPALLLTASAPD